MLGSSASWTPSSFIAPGKPQQNAVAESFTGHLRDECLNETLLAGSDGATEAVAPGAGTLARWLAQGLRAAGLRVVVPEARQAEATPSGLRNETGRNNARGIARILHAGRCRGRCRGVHAEGLDGQRARPALSARKALLRRRIGIENEMRGLPKVFGTGPPARLRHGQPAGTTEACAAPWAAAPPRPMPWSRPSTAGCGSTTPGASRGARPSRAKGRKRAVAATARKPAATPRGTRSDGAEFRRGEREAAA